jgi:Na+-translocating ferredoxin:NAD+ oxidoreductase RnfD subunit
LILSFSLVLILGAAVLVLCRYATLRLSHALVCVLFGFYLASSQLAPTISDAMDTLVQLVSGR